MKKFFRAFLPAFVLLPLPLLSHCAPYSDVERLQNQLRTANRRVEDLKSNQTDGSQLRQQMQDLQSQLDDSNLANARLKEQNKSLEASLSARAKLDSGKHDEAISKMEGSLHAKDEHIATLEKQLKIQQDKKINDTEKALKEAQTKAEVARAKAKTLSASTPASAEVKRINRGQAKIVKRMPTVSNKPASKPVSKPTTTAATAAPPAAATTAATSSDQVPPSAPATAKTTGVTKETEHSATTNDKLAEGKQLYAQKQYAKAQAAFESYLASKPSANQAAEADYMIGECNYQNKQYDLAIISYQKVASKPSLNKAAAATLKQGMAFEQMADLEMAKTIYKKLADQHPGTSEAKTAKERLGKL